MLQATGLIGTAEEIIEYLQANSPNAQYRLTLLTTEEASAHRYRVLPNPVSPLSRLQRWYADHCDGDWQHDHGISIGNIDNPGWILDVDLTGTELEMATFENYRENYDHDLGWISCGLQNGHFVCNGGPLKLERMIEIFLALAETSFPVATTMLELPAS